MTPLSKEERHALAARVRLGETFPVPTAWAGKRWWNWENYGSPVFVLGVQVGISSSADQGRFAMCDGDTIPPYSPTDGISHSEKLLNWLEKD